MIVYKGTDKDMKCRGFQFELGKEYVEEEAILCEKGFHGCEYPLDVFAHCTPSDSRFFVADLDGVTDERESCDTKRVGTKIKLRAEIGIAGIVKAAVEYIKERAESSDNQTGYCSAATNTGDSSAATNTGPLLLLLFPGAACYGSPHTGLLNFYLRKPTLGTHLRV